MPDKTRNTPQLPRSRHWARRTHRVLGLASLLFIAVISASGLLLNHADGLKLSQTAAGTWLARLYGIAPPPIDSSFAAGKLFLATADDTLYSNGVELANGVDRLIGAVPVGAIVVAASDDELFITTADGALVERFATDPSITMQRIGVSGQRVFADLSSTLLEINVETMNFAAPADLPTLPIDWSQQETPTKSQLQRVGATAVGRAINWERVLLDLHSGRILPGLGRYLADLTALALLYMCFSGFLIWRRRR